MRAVAHLTSTKPNRLVMVRAGSWPSVISWVTATSSARLGARVVPVDQHRALLEQRAVPLDDQVGHRVQQRVARGEQVGARLAVGAGQLLVERHPLVPGAAPGGAGADLAVPVADVGGDVADLVAAGLAFGRSVPPSSRERGSGRTR